MIYQYSIELALFDFIPVMLSALGMYFIVQIINANNQNYQTLTKVAAAMIVFGGVSKATWKLLVATNGVDIAILNNNLFIFMAPGFAFLTFCLYAARKQFNQQAIKPTAWRCPASIVTLFAILSIALAVTYPDKKLWFFALLGLLTISNIIFIWHAIRHSLQAQSKTSALLYLLNIIGVFALSGIARMNDQREAIQWIAEFTNTATQGAFALAGYLLWKKTQSSLAATK
ncbi:hypothetical protein [Thalassomonas sp. M1454]|uniref:hypothetical protein n=1 Tax=Thalassomonas sp. M1454 TaxID=2594477 RepID=UPI00117F966F|nr:hypothetical protein [Thalassomonas sp. M1454]TRX55010.1 hypothetical protein FNN08_10440 [Thalassomonas sp. M1454]